MDKKNEIKSLFVSFINAQSRYVNAERGAYKVLRRTKNDALGLAKQVFRPSLPILRGAVAVMNGFAETAEGCIHNLSVLTAALPDVTAAIKKSADAAGLPDFEEMQAAMVDPEVQKAAKTFKENLKKRDKSIRSTGDDENVN